MPPPEAFYVQAADGSLMSVPFGTAFGLVKTETGHHVVAQVNDDLRVALFTGSEEAAREYLQHLPLMFQQAGIPTVLSQHVVTPQQAQADREDNARWGIRE